VKWRTWKYQTEGKEFLCDDANGEVVFGFTTPGSP
jgi:hypothetical protein